MVKNEERNVRRLFESVRPWIDGYVLCDTGSTDGTVALAKGLMAEFGKPGKVYEYPWENFGKSRTRSFQSFQDWVNTVGWNPATTYGLLLDGDMVLPEEGGMHVKLAVLSPEHSGAQLSQRNGSLIYKNTRLLRASKTWKCIGSTHEYWSCESGGHTADFDAPVITDIGDGGCKADKFPRDAALLEEDLKTDPNNVRTWFYLGQTYMSIPGKNEDAVRCLTRRIELGGWEEERYIAHCYKGDCLKHLGREAEATEEWLKAWQLRQHRTEAPLRLIQHYRAKPAMAFVAHMYLEKLVQIQTGETLEGHRVGQPARNTDVLFVSHRDMVYPVWEELGITAFYAGRPEGARRALDKKVMASTLNFNEHNRLLDLYRWYAWTLPTVRPRVALAVGAEHVPFMKDGFWRAFNPSIRLVTGGEHYRNLPNTGAEQQCEGDRGLVRTNSAHYVVNLRHANYETKEARFYTYRGLDGLIVTRNVVAPMDGDFRVLTDASGAVPRPFEIKIPAEYVVNKSTNIIGFEDCRWLGDRSLVATSRQFNPTDMNKMVRVDLDYESGAIVRMKTLMAPVPSEEGDCQKNWLPFVWGGQEVFVYKVNPFQVFTMKGYKKLVDWSPPAACGITFDNLRGSAPPVPWKSATQPREALVMVVHFCFYGAGDEGRRYYHRFITLNDDLTPSRISRIFSLCDDKIQYVAGMCERIGGGGYVLTYGVGDSQAWAAEVATEVVEAALEYRLA